MKKCFLFFYDVWSILCRYAIHTGAWMITNVLLSKLTVVSTTFAHASAELSRRTDADYPRYTLNQGMFPAGYHSALGLVKNYGKGSGVVAMVVMELKEVIDSKRWIYAWVYLLVTVSLPGCLCGTSSGSRYIALLGYIVCYYANMHTFDGRCKIW